MKGRDPDLPPPTPALPHRGEGSGSSGRAIPWSFGRLKKYVEAGLLGLLLASAAFADDLRGTGDLGVIIERATASVQIVEHTTNRSLARVEGFGDLSHASLVYSRDARYAFVFGRDGGLTKLDLLTARIVGRTMQSGNSIGGAISQDGRFVAVANYEPGGVKVFDSANLELVADIPAVGSDGKQSKVIGLEDAPGNRFLFSLWESGEIWMADLSKEPKNPELTRYTNIGRNPYDALITLDGHYYLAGLFGEDGVAMLDMWNTDAGVKRILPEYGQGEQKLPVFKMPHLEGWGVAGNLAFLPAVGHHEVLVIDMSSWQVVRRIPVLGQPVFVMARPDGRQIWVNFALPDNGKVQVIDVRDMAVVSTLEPGKGVLHMEFTPRGERVWLSERDEDRVDIYDTATLQKVGSLPAEKPSGIFFTDRSHKIGL